jgi:S-adenosylmethionine:tRNA ribosyltransferase-isomerase
LRLLINIPATSVPIGGRSRGRLDLREARQSIPTGESTSDYDYPLPPDRIAQTPLADRESSRLLVVNRATGACAHRNFTDLLEYLAPGDVLVLNDTRVTAMRLFAEQPDRPGKHIEVFLLGRRAESLGAAGTRTHEVSGGPRSEDERTAAFPHSGAESRLWEALVKPGKKMLPGVSVFAGPLRVTVIDRTDDRGGRLLRVDADAGVDVDAELASRSFAPLPPYIGPQLDGDARERYQTVYAAEGGSAAAPTAGLHFTPALLDRIAAKGVVIARLTLHVGMGTFRPIETDVISAHRMHAERFSLPVEAANLINHAKGRIIAVGTTSARTLEAAAAGSRKVVAQSGETSLYVTPGYRFCVVDALITNFHMPRSTLLLLVSAFAGRERILAAYAEALERNYRFLSFGDAMLII